MYNIINLRAAGFLCLEGGGCLRLAELEIVEAASLSRESEEGRDLA